jgi:hypothetical protein
LKVKKILFIIIVIAVLINAVASLDPGRSSLDRFTPSLERTESVTAIDYDDESIYLVEYDSNKTYIYRVDKNGKITALYSDTIHGNIAAMTVHNDNLYCVVDSLTDTANDNISWYILQLPANLKGGGAKRIYEERIDQENNLVARITDISGTSMRGGGLVIAGISDDGLTARTLKFKQEDFSEPILDLSVNAASPTDIIVSAVTNGSTLRIVHKSGAGLQEAAELKHTKQDIEFDSLTTPLSIRFSMLRIPSFAFAVWEIALTAALILSAAILLFSKKIANRTTAGFALSLLVLFTVLAQMQNISTTAALSQGRLDEARGKSVYISQILDGYRYTNFNSDTFFTTDSYSELSKHFGVYTDTRQEVITQSRTELIFVNHLDQPVTAISERFSFKLPANEAYCDAVMTAIESAIESHQSKSAISGRNTVSVTPCLYAGRVAAIVITQVSNDGIDYRLSRARSDYMQTGLTIIFAAVLIMFLFNKGLTHPLSRIIRRMGKYGDGRFDTGNYMNEFGKVSSKGDVGAMERAVTEMGVSLAINEYETKTMINSFYRFVPRGAEKLLNRAGIPEISSGDIACIKDNLCLLSVENRESVQKLSDDKGYMSFVNDCFSVIYENAQRLDGMLLSGDFNLSSLPIMFAGDSVKALQFGLDAITDGDNDNDGKTTPDFFMFLHNTKFLYGIAGTEEKAFPFLSSHEINFLNSYSSRLRSLNIKVVMTENYYKSLPAEHDFSARFVGFIASQDGAYRYKLYESLDCFCESEKLLRKRYNEKFQNAITMFLKNDFYLARSEFSSILRSNPTDGVARWYIFACEHLFNSGDLSQAAYNLFGIE